jgi:hypothetical protein
LIGRETCLWRRHSEEGAESFALLHAGERNLHWAEPASWVWRYCRLAERSLQLLARFSRWIGTFAGCHCPVSSLAQDNILR